MTRQCEAARTHLTNKLQILRNLAAKTETLSVFIKCHEMRGLKRVLCERKKLISELALVNKQLSDNLVWKHMSDAAHLAEEINQLEKQLLMQNRQVVEAAVRERITIAAELRKSKAQRLVNKQYLNPYNHVISHGRRINKKG